MLGIRSYRAKLRLLVLGLGLLAIGITGWEASAGAAAAMRQATYDRLAAVRETRSRQIERYFADVGNHVLALSADEATIEALGRFRATWATLPPADADSEAALAVRRYYDESHSLGEPAEAEALADWLPADPLVLGAQHLFLADNPHPVGAKDLLLTVPEAGPYGEAHARYHPTFHRYQSAFGFYDIFLIDASTRRILYTVFKEIDFGVPLAEPPYAHTGLARAVERALQVEGPELVVVEDYSPYPPSYFAPAAFLAAPVWSAGSKVGVLAIQVSVAEVNRVMAGEQQWELEGLGRTGQSYLVAADGTYRSDPRRHVEDPEAFVRALQADAGNAGSAATLARYGTAILNLRVDADLASRVMGPRGTELGTDARGVEVLRSHAPLDVPGLEWAIVAEIESAEALAPVRALQQRILGIGGLVAVAFFAAGTWLARSVTTPVLALAEGARRLESLDFQTRIPVTSEDEIGGLAHSFNRMAERLERTTVSKAELEVLAGRLITAQEDERRRLARELHDDLTQRLAALAIEAGLLEHAHARGRVAAAGPQPGEAGAPDPAHEHIVRIRQELSRLSTDIHQLSRRLHPATLDDLGLVAAIESEGRAFFERGGPPVALSTNGELDDLDRDVQLTLYRIVQEGLHNVQKHAEAHEVRVVLTRTADRVRLVIEDDGRGFDRARATWRPGLGLASMEERARLANGTCTVTSAPGQGTRIEVLVPVMATPAAPSAPGADPLEHP